MFWLQVFIVFRFGLSLLHQLRTLSSSKFHWWITVMINWNIWKAISLLLWSNVYTYISFFIDFYQEVICYSLTNFSGLAANYMWSTCNLFWFLTSRYASYVGWQNNTTFFFTNFAWKTSLDPSQGKHLCLNTWQHRLKPQLCARENESTKTSFPLQPLVTESCLGRCDLVLSPLFMSTNMAAVTSADVSSH